MDHNFMLIIVRFSGCDEGCWASLLMVDNRIEKLWRVWEAQTFFGFFFRVSMKTFREQEKTTDIWTVKVWFFIPNFDFVSEVGTRGLNFPTNIIEHRTFDDHFGSDSKLICHLLTICPKQVAHIGCLKLSAHAASGIRERIVCQQRKKAYRIEDVGLADAVGASHAIEWAEVYREPNKILKAVYF